METDFRLEDLNSLMELEKPCDYCGERKAVAKCEVCGSMVCREDKLDHGCKVCGGGEQQF